MLLFTCNSHRLRVFVANIEGVMVERSVIVALNSMTDHVLPASSQAHEYMPRRRFHLASLEIETGNVLPLQRITGQYVLEI